jgi:dipeptidase E
MILLLSDFTDHDNEELLSEIRNIFSDRTYSIAYIPSTTDYTLKHFDNVKQHLTEYGKFEILMYDIDTTVNQTTIDGIFKSDLIYFSGGNPFYFLNNIKKINLIQRVREFYQNGGNLIGLSAGGILMADTIGSSYFGSENTVNLQDITAFAFIDFEIMPHWKCTCKFLKELLDYTDRTKQKVVTMNDGDGIVIDNKRRRLFGEFQIIENGAIRVIEDNERRE